MTYPEIAQKFPVDFEARKKDKLQYRWEGVFGGGGRSLAGLDGMGRIRWNAWEHGS